MSESIDKPSLADVDIGQHCNFNQCNRFDYLPVRCEKCLSNFCRDHSSLTAHNCPKWIKNDDDKLIEPVTFNSAVNAFMCQLDQCKVKEIIEFRCEFCKLNFCKLHRLQHDHKCSHLPKYEACEKKETKEFKFEVKQNVSEKNMKLAAKLTVMKMRKTAIGPPGLPEESKFYCFIQYESDEKRPFYSSLKWPVGKFIEFLFEKLSISKTLITKKKLFLNGEMVDSSLTCEELVTKNSLNPGVVLILREI